jgi:hypothetical protein
MTKLSFRNTIVPCTALAALGLACAADQAPGSQGLPGSSAGTGAAAGATAVAGSAGSAGSTAGAGAAGTGMGGSGGTQPVINTMAGTTGAGSGGAVNCGAESHQAMIKPLAMYLLVDQSGSMTDGVDRWNPVATAVQAFVQDPASAGIKVALGYFPFSSEEQMIKCDVASYQMPEVPMGVLPDTSPAVTASFGMRPYMQTVRGETPMARSSTPTRPAVEGSYSYLSGWLATNPDHIGVLVLATDGEPTQCTSNVAQDVAATIAAAAAATPPITTYVIGIGGLQNLELFAEAGDTGRGPFIVDGTGANTQAEFLDAMAEIRGAALPCNFDIPLPTDGDADYSKVNVDYQADATSAAVPFFKVDDEAACAGNPNSWYYDDPSLPTAIVLCAEACGLVTANQTSNVSISLGCETRVR